MEIRRLGINVLVGLALLGLAAGAVAAVKPVLDLSGHAVGTYVGNNNDSGDLELDLRRAGSIRKYRGSLTVRGDETRTYIGHMKYTRSDRIKGTFASGSGRRRVTIKFRGQVFADSKTIEGSYRGKAGRRSFDGLFDLTLQ